MMKGRPVGKQVIMPAVEPAPEPEQQEFYSPAELDAHEWMNKFNSSDGKTRLTMVIDAQNFQRNVDQSRERLGILQDRVHEVEDDNSKLRTQINKALNIIDDVVQAQSGISAIGGGGGGNGNYVRWRPGRVGSSANPTAWGGANLFGLLKNIRNALIT